MTWQIALGVLLVINIGSVILSKLASDALPEKSKGIFWLYLFSACIVVLWFGFSGKEFGVGVAVFLMIIAIGFINGFGNYCMWKAFGESLSKSVLFFPLMEVCAIGLAVFFLGEFQLWNQQLLLGAILCFAAIWIFRFTCSRSAKKGKASKIWLFSILGMVIVGGLTTFLVQVCSFTIPKGTFLMGWYIGSFLSTPVLLKLEKANPFQKISKKTVLLCLVTAVAIVGALGALYWTYQLGGPASSVLPIKGLAITIIPVIIGWLILKERRLSKTEWLGFVVGLIGAILILLR